MPAGPTTLSRRALLAGAAALGVAAARRRAAAGELTIPRIPLSFAVAMGPDGGVPVRDEPWLEEQVGEMDALFGPLGVHPWRASVRAISARHADLVTRSDRDALAAEVRPGVANVFIVSTLMDVDEPPRMRRGVHWRQGSHPATRYVIVASEAPPTVLAHEMGHYFGLGHTAAVDNLMSYERTGGPVYLDPAQRRGIQEAARRAFATGELVASAHGDPR